MKKKIGTIFISFALVGCKNTNANVQGSKVPTYQGMSVTRFTPLSDSSSKKMKKDLSEIVHANSFVDPTVRYYVNPGETFRLHVSLSNPSGFEIQSITINGIKYASYMFSSGSDLENVYIEMTALDISGYQNYELQTMKYLDNTQIKDISVTKNNILSVGVKYKNTPVASIENKTITANSFKSDVVISDPDSLIQNNPLTFYISDGEKIVYQKDLDIGKNNVEYNALNCGDSYQLGVFTTIDLADGRNKHAEWLTKEDFTTMAAFSFENVVIGKDSVQFDVAKRFSIDAHVIKIDLVKDGKVIATAKDSSRFDNLLSNCNYRLELTYSYKDSVKDTVSYSFKTLERSTPSFELSLLSSSYDSLKVHFDKKDDENCVSSVSLSLTDKAGNLIKEAKDVNDVLFENLDSGTAYNVSLAYFYDLKDGRGSIKRILTNEYKTLAYEEPTVSEKEKSIEYNSIYVSYALSQDFIGQIDSIALYDGSSLIEKINDTEGKFDSLNSDHDYVVEVAFSYDLKDGKGTRTVTNEFSYHTNPLLKVTSLEILNEQTSYKDGDTISLKATFDNPSNLAINKIKVSGQEYEVSGSNQTVFFNYVIQKGTFDSAGLNTLVIEGFSASGKDSSEYEYCFMESPISITFEYFKDISTNGIKIPDRYVDQNEDYFIELNVGNTTTQKILSVTDEADNVYEVINSGGKVKAKLPTTKSGMNTVKISYLNYLNDGETKSVSFKKTVFYYVIPAGEAISITTVQEFMNMKSSQKYSLDADLDFSGVKDYVPFDFIGCILGNNHTIKNLNIVGKENVNCAGIFASFGGFIKDLKLDNVTVLSENVEGVEHIGLIAGENYDACLVNVEAEANTNVKISGDCAALNSAGGFFGWTEYYNKIIVENCLMKSYISSSGKNIPIGGVSGKLNDGYAFVSNFENSSFIKNDVKIQYGGLFGYMVSANIEVEDYLFNPDVSKSRRNPNINGIVSSCEYENTFRINHYLDVISKNPSGSLFTKADSLYTNSALISFDTSTSFQNCTTENCYANNSSYGDTELGQEMMTVEFYTKKLGFSTSKWDFSKVSQKGAPILKRN